MAKDPVGAISRVGRMEAFQFNNTTAGDIFRSRDKIRANVNQLGPKNSMTITQVYPRKLAVIVKLLHVNFLLEIESGHSSGNICADLKDVKEHLRPPSTVLTDAWLQRFKFNLNISMRVTHVESIVQSRSGSSTKRAGQRLAPKIQVPFPWVPNAEFHKCVADAWDDATVATMRNCFAHVPSSPENQDSDNDDKPSPDEAQEDSQEGGQKEPEQRVSQRTLVLHLLANIQSSVEKLRTLATDPEAEDDFIVPATLTSLDAICKRVDLLDDLVAFRRGQQKQRKDIP
ncbi:hypothetical protein EDD21DRAFT_409538 [Dissophora ornata]|nr:hypothetical protein EDD21DRAFT_409538 [Dissophora ornata]